MAKNKKQKLEDLDTLLLDRMIDIMKTKDVDKIATLSDLSVPMNYLRNNAVVADKSKSSVEKDIQENLNRAKQRRKDNESIDPGPTATV